MMCIRPIWVSRKPRWPWLDFHRWTFDRQVCLMSALFDVGILWENHGKTMGKPWENGDLYSNQSLVGGLEHDFYDFPYIGNVIIPFDELIFFRGLGLNHQPVMVCWVASRIASRIESKSWHFGTFWHIFPGCSSPDCDVDHAIMVNFTLRVLFYFILCCFISFNYLVSQVMFFFLMFF